MKDLDTLPKLRVIGAIAPRQEGSLFGESFSAADVVDFLEAHKEDNDIVVEISSYGGSVSEGKEIYTRLVQSGKNITTVTFKAYSIATLLMLSGKKRLIVEDADFGIHQARVFGDDLSGMELLADDLFKIGREIEASSEDILNIYCRTLGEDKRTLLMAKMAQDINLGARESIKLGFANGYYKRKTEKVENSRKAITITNHGLQLIKNSMSKENDALAKLESILNAGVVKFSKMFSRIKNEVTLPIQGGGSIYIVPVNPDAPDDLKNAKAYLIDEAGLPTETPYPDGSVTLDDGRTLTIAAGVVTAVSDVVDANKLQEEKKALETANAALQAKVTELEAKATAMATQNAADKTAAEKEVLAIQNAFTEYKKIVPGEKTKDKDDEIIQMDFSKMTTAQKVRAMSKQREKFDSERKELLNQQQ